MGLPLCIFLTRTPRCAQAINKEESKVSISDRKILLVLAKAEDAQGHWPRLLKGTGKMPNVKVRPFARSSELLLLLLAPCGWEPCLCGNKTKVI